jgi:hypothetical protein
MRNALLAAAVFLVTSCYLASAAAGCPRRSSPAYTAQVDRALRAGTDVWGAGEPSYAELARRLHPLRFARGPGGRRLTATGVYYLPFGSLMLHVGDGSQLIERRVGGPSVLVRAGGRRFESCTEKLADGWLPILQTAAGGYRQESFAVGGTSFVRLDGPRPQVGALVGSGTLYARWSGGPVERVDAAAYDAARASVVDYWTKRLAQGAAIEVPDARVMNAERALLAQNLTLTWRYSIGNPYEEFSFPEGVDVAQVLAEWGFGAVSRSILRTSLTRAPRPYPNWKMGEKLLGSAVQYRLAGDAAYIRQATPVLRGYVEKLAAQLGANGLLARERYSSDIPDQVYGLHGQAVVWQGLRAIADVWAETGQPALAARAHSLAARLEGGLRRALAQSQRRLPDGSLFVPMRLLDRETAYRTVTQERAGSYWNLVAPYAFASGLLSPAQERGAWRYLQLHGSRLAGLVRAGAYALYGRRARPPVSGTDQVYGLNAARFLARIGAGRELRLSLYGHLAAGMTPDTFVSGEGATLAPLHGEWYRSMYLPPNGASNGAFLETLRLLLVRETNAALDLAWAVPRAWTKLAVRRLPTSYGPVSFSIDGSHVTVDLPGRRPRRVTLHVGSRTLDLSGRSGHVELEVG